VTKKSVVKKIDFTKERVYCLDTKDYGDYTT